MSYRKRHPPLPADPPPLIRIADLYTNRVEGRHGYLPLSWRTLQRRIRDLNIKVHKLGRIHCITRDDLSRLQEGEDTTAPAALKGRAKQLAAAAAKRRGARP